MAKKVKRTKRDSDEIDKLIAEVDELHNKGMSVNRACAKVGLQNTVYYFRKRRDVAEAAGATQATAPTKTGTSFDTSLHERKDTDTLMREYRELEQRMLQIKMAIAEKVMSKQM